ncbi:mucin-2-like [Lucilia sericata]|uniref:mucin-2-like n=1 Tax=Lucilia sericata TaxID=13632 RepID=UPI0018A86BF2|nr:mucin-2-like [Lucilia sericata]
MKILILKVIILLLGVNGIRSECDVCQSTNFVACHKENEYSLCINGVPTEDFITCPENYVCTPDPYVCYPLPEAKPSCVRHTHLCGVCSENKVYACINETTIAFCYGEDKPVEGADVSYCLGDTVCDIYSTKGFCTESYLAKPSCVTNPNDYDYDDPVTVTTTAEPTTTSTTTEPTTTTTKATTTTTTTETTTTTTTTQPTTTTTTTEPTTTTTEATTTTTQPTTTTEQTTTTTTTTEPTTTTTTTEPTTTTTTTEPTTTTTTTTTEPTTTTTTTEPTTTTTTTEPTTTTTTEPTTTTTTTTTTEPTTTTTTTEPTTTTTTTESTTTTTTTEPTTTTTTTESTTTTTTEPTTTSTTTTKPSGPVDPEVFCKDAATTGSFYAGDPKCTTFVLCYEMSKTIHGMIKKCPSNQYFPPGADKCSSHKPDICVYYLLFLLVICVACVQTDCDVCQSSNNVACHKENVFSLCINGIPTEDFITCPENHVCTADPKVCYPLPEAKPTCVRDSNQCGVCSKNKVYACINETTIAFCYGADQPVEGADVSYCLGDTVCDIYSEDGFCTESRLSKPSCVINDDTTTETSNTESTPPTTEPSTTSTDSITETTDPTTITTESIITTTEIPTTTTSPAPTVPSTPRDPDTICKDAATTGSYYADDPTCTTFVVCYLSGNSLAGIKKNCKAGQYFPPGAKFCAAPKPDLCI